jgi:hypothetical protein
MSSDGMLTIPVSATFGGEPIGELRVRKDALPGIPNFVFALAYRTIGGDPFAGFELCEVAIQTDAQYLRYLQSDPRHIQETKEQQ